VQLVTGLFLWMAYNPSSQTAWESVYYIQHDVFLGWLLRGIHHFTAQAMIVLLVVHLLQVIIDGAYKAPREVNFWVGLILMQVVLGLSLTGYLLARTGRRDEARAVLRTLEEGSSTHYVPPYAMALVEAGLGDRERVFAWLEKAYVARDVHLIYLPVDPKWDPYRADPRFVALLAKCGFVSGS
jgi:quinol-cytochrome oxidoreductase complex cytochrome b subunit